MIKIKKLPLIKGFRRRPKKVPPTEELRQILRMFILPFVHQAANRLSLSDGIRAFFQADKVGVYFCKAKKDFLIPKTAKAWIESPSHPPVEAKERKVKRGDPVILRVNYESDMFELEFKEVVFRLQKTHYQRIKRKLRTIC